MKLETPCPICKDAAGESAVVEIVRNGTLLYHCNGCGSEIQPQWWSGKKARLKVIAARLAAADKKEGAQWCEGCEDAPATTHDSEGILLCSKCAALK